MEIAGLVASAIGCYAYLVRQRAHVANLKEKLIRLGDKLEELSSRESDVRAELDIARAIRGKTPKSAVQLWLDNIERMEAEVAKIEARTDAELGSCMPNWFLRIKLSKKIAKKIKQVEDILENGRFPEGLLVELSMGHGKILSIAALFGKTTTMKNLGMIWDALNDAGTGKIGVYGMGGSGKTTILMHVNNQIVCNHIFNDVIWVTVSRTPNLMKLQHEIAKALNLDLFSDNEDETSRAAKLLHIFMQWKKFVLILDDVWTAYPLHRIGIPEPNRANGLKLVLTTRSLEVCRGMEVEKVIKINLLSKEEAWDLFRDKVGRHVVLDPTVENVARLVVDECGCLPLGIVTVGGGMREVTDIRAWRSALYELKNSAAKNKGMETEVLECLRFSYNHLADERVRECFLYCALYPNGRRIPSQELVGCWIAEGLVDNQCDIEAAKDKCYVIISELQNACLLEAVTNESGGEEFVKMHDLVRDMAIDITRIDRCFMVHAGTGLKKPPSAEAWYEGLRRISVMDNEIETMTGQPRCPKLSTLFIQGNTRLRHISSSFFGRMPQLKVLNLSNTGIESLPESVSFLTKLRSLLLRDCVKLRNLPSFENLTELRVLNLVNTAVEFLPTGLNRLSKLRSLDLSRTAGLQHIDREPILALTALEDLSTYGSRWKWAVTSESGGATVADLATSESLVNLNVQFLDLEASGYYVQSRRCKSLLNFNFLVGPKTPSLVHAQPKERTVYVGGPATTGLTGNPFPDSTLDLSVNDCHGLTYLPRLMLMNLCQLEECSVSRCKRLEYILEEKQGSNFPRNLLRLWLWELPRLQGLCEGTGASGTFANLKSLTIYECGSLTCLFSAGMWKQLRSLEVIDVCSCVSMEEIFSTEAELVRRGDTNAVVLPNLKRISLDFLPSLTSIARGALVCDSLRFVTVDFCPMLTRLPFSAAGLPTNLEYVHGCRTWWDALEWDHEVTKSFFNKYCSLHC